MLRGSQYPDRYHFGEFGQKLAVVEIVGQYAKELLNSGKVRIQNTVLRNKVFQGLANTK